MPPQNRQLAAILFTDMVGYTAMMQQDEQQAVNVSKRYASVLKETVLAHGGEVLNDYGDGSLCTFSSATQAVLCAMEMQQQLQTGVKVPLRIGLHIGEVFFEDGKIFGDGVNVASRIQSIGTANSILFSSEINSKLKNQVGFTTVSLGRFHFKNVDESVEVFALSNSGFVVPDKKKLEGKLAPKKSQGNKYLLIAAIVAVILVAVFFIFRNRSSAPGFTGKDKSIAVLPFETISSEKENEYINDGFTIDIINKLSRLSGLTSVPGWARVKIFKNTTRALKDIANELGVASLLTGTIQKQGDKLHIIAELIDVNTGKTIWNTDDDRKWGDVLILQSEVAQKIVSSLSAHITPEEQQGIRKQYTENTEAYAHYIKGRYFWDTRTTMSFDSAEANYKKAIELDPNYGLAYTGLADLFIFNQKGLNQLEAIPIARDYATKALALDSTLVEAITTLGFIESNFDYEWAKAKATLEKAIRLNPKYAYAHIYYGNLLQYTGESTERGIEEIKKARELDPLSASVNWVLGRNYYFAGQLGLAEEQLRKTVNLNSNYPIARAYLGLTLVEEKKYAEAYEVFKRQARSGIVKSGEYQGPLLAYAYGRAGNIPLGQAEFNRCMREDTFYKAHYILARTYMGLNNFTAALAEIDQAIKEKDIALYFLKVDPCFYPLANDPRFQAMLHRIGLN